MQRFGKVVSYHDSGWAIFDLDFLGFDIVYNEEITNIHVSGTLSTGSASIGFQQDRASVILIKDIVVNLKTLSLEEV